MRFSFPLSILAGCLIAIALISNLTSPRTDLHPIALWSELIDAFEGTRSPNENVLVSRSSHDVERIRELELYEDLEYGFSVAIPVGWRRIVTPDMNGDSVDEVPAASGTSSNAYATASAYSLEPGYAVGFESVQQSLSDPFADYILIEILPGDESGLFEADPALRSFVTIDGRVAGFDRLEIDHVDSGLIDVDLIVYQAELSGVGYTVGLYAIGEPIREQLLATAFEVMLQTFKVIRDPFSVS